MGTVKIVEMRKSLQEWLNKNVEETSSSLDIVKACVVINFSHSIGIITDEMRDKLISAVSAISHRRWAVIIDA